MPSAGITAVVIGITLATILHFFFSSSEQVERLSLTERTPNPPNSNRRRRRSNPYDQGYDTAAIGPCSICLESLTTGMKVVLNPCRHMFHNKCIAEWISTANQASCPNCRCRFT